MAVKSSGSLSFNTDIVGEFGGSTPHSLSEYYSGGDNVPSGVTDVPSSGAIDFSDFYGTSNSVTVTYRIVGGGGGGGAGGGVGGSAGGAGGSSSIASADFTTVTATGGGGGAKTEYYISDSSDTYQGGAGGVGVTIDGTTYAVGGRGGDGYNSGANDNSYGGGGGGGGAGGDGGIGQFSGAAGGTAAQDLTGTVTATVGSTITVTVGAGGAAGTGFLNCTAGTSGFVRLTINGTDYDFTSSGTHTV